MTTAWDNQTGQTGRMGSWKAPAVRAKEAGLDYTKRVKAKPKKLEDQSDDEILAALRKKGY